MIRMLLSQTLYRTGFIGLWKALTRDRVSILTIHSVLDQGIERPWWPLRSYLPAERLRENLAFLKSRRTFVSLEHAVRILRGDASPEPNATVITFDDGYLNNFTDALPILEELEIPATFFVVSGYVETGRPYWFDRVDYALQKNVTGPATLPLPGGDISVASGSRDDLKRAMHEVFERVKMHGDREQVLEEVADEIIGPVEAIAGRSLLDDYGPQSPCAIVDEDTMRVSARSPLVTIGSHTHSHVRLPLLEREEAMTELRHSARVLERMSDADVRLFCYPNGTFDQTAAEWVESAGYLAATTSVEGQNTRGANVMQLRRINWSPTASAVELFALATGVYRDVFR